MQQPGGKARTYLLVGLAIVGTVWLHDRQNQPVGVQLAGLDGAAAAALRQLPIKPHAPSANYDRDLFGDGWVGPSDCDTRDRILQRDLVAVTYGGEGCTIVSGHLLDPYTGKTMPFKRGPGTSNNVQIDHVVALSNAWRTGAQALGYRMRVKFANDPLELLAVKGSANQAKGGQDAAHWLPKNKAFRCVYVARQIYIKAKYHLWVTKSEKSAMARVLSRCPKQPLPRPLETTYLPSKRLELAFAPKIC